MIAQPYFCAPLTSIRRQLVAPFLAMLALLASNSFSQTERIAAASVPAPTTAAITSAKTDPTNPKKIGEAKSGWSKLTQQQQKTLQPLANSWDSLNTGQQRKWLEVSRNYATLSAEDKVSMNSRMAEWAALSNRERAEARLNFAKSKELSHELTALEQKAKWEAYQSLSAEEKKKLTDKGSRPPSGAATATRPVAPQKLATLPVPVTASSKQTKMSADPRVGRDNPVTSDH